MRLWWGQSIDSKENRIFRADIRWKRFAHFERKAERSNIRCAHAGLEWKDLRQVGESHIAPRVAAKCLLGDAETAAAALEMLLHPALTTRRQSDLAVGTRFAQDVRERHDGHLTMGRNRPDHRL